MAARARPAAAQHASRMEILPLQHHHSRPCGVRRKRPRDGHRRIVIVVTISLSAQCGGPRFGYATAAVHGNPGAASAARDARTACVPRTNTTHLHTPCASCAVAFLREVTIYRRSRRRGSIDDDGRGVKTARGKYYHLLRDSHAVARSDRVLYASDRRSPKFARKKKRLRKPISAITRCNVAASCFPVRTRECETHRGRTRYAPPPADHVSLSYCSVQCAVRFRDDKELRPVTSSHVQFNEIAD